MTFCHRRDRGLRETKVFGVTACLLLSVLAPAAAAEPATPQRPSVSTDTATTAFRSFELEAGASTDDASNSSLAATLKYGVSGTAELFASALPYVDVDGAGDGFGDLVVGTRVRVLKQRGARPSGAYQLAGRLPTGDEEEGLGSGEVDFLSTWIATWALGRQAVTANYALGVLGGDAGLEHGLVVTLSSPLAGDLSGFVELSGFVQPKQDVEIPLFSLGLGYSLSPSFVLDAAAFVGLGAEAPDFSATIGLTTNFGRL